MHMKRGKSFAGVMKYHEQDSHAPDGIKLREFSAHSFVGGVHQDNYGATLRRSSWRIAAKYQESTLPSITNRDHTHTRKFDLPPNQEITGAISFSLLPLHTLRANWPKDMIDVEHSHPSVFDWTVLHVCRISELTEPVMGEGDEPLIESRSIFVANTKRIGFRVGGCKHEPNQALPMEHRDKLTSETRSLDF
jgi:hypothetical protein